MVRSDVVDLKYLLALLNSKLLNRQYQKLNPEQGRVFAQVKIDYVNELPIVISNPHTSTLIALVDNILEMKASDIGADTAMLEGKIDKIVYSIYGLTETEIAAVDSSRY
jgi:adenine-specific DNA-methyltransferase